MKCCRCKIADMSEVMPSGNVYFVLCSPCYDWVKKVKENSDAKETDKH